MKPEYYRSNLMKRWYVKIHSAGFKIDDSYCHVDVYVTIQPSGQTTVGRANPFMRIIVEENNINYYGGKLSGDLKKVVESRVPEYVKTAMKRVNLSGDVESRAL